MGKIINACENHPKHKSMSNSINKITYIGCVNELLMNSQSVIFYLFILLENNMIRSPLTYYFIFKYNLFNY